MQAHIAITLYAVVPIYVTTSLTKLPVIEVGIYRPKTRGATMDSKTYGGNEFTAISEAELILRDHFLGPSDAAHIFGSTVTEQSDTEKVPFTVSQLRHCSQTHVLVFAPNQGLEQLFASSVVHFGSYGPVIKEARAFSRKPRSPWYLLRRTPVFGSLGQHMSGQLAYLLPEESVPSAIELVVGTALYLAKSGLRLYKHAAVRTADEVLVKNYKRSDLLNITLTPHDKNLVRLDAASTERADPNLGLAAIILPS